MNITLLSFYILIWPALACCVWMLAREAWRCFTAGRRFVDEAGLYAILALGAALSAALRTAAVAYIEYTNMKLGTNMLYLSSGAVLFLLAAAMGAGCAAERLCGPTAEENEAEDV